MTRFRKIFLGLCLLSLLLACGVWLEIHQAMTPRRNDVTIDVSGMGFSDAASLDGLRIALISDIHLTDQADSATALQGVIDDVLAAHPDLVLLTGDYPSHLGSPLDQGSIRSMLQSAFVRLQPLPAYGVLGNHDQNAGWGRFLEGAGINFVENRVIPLQLRRGTGQAALCIRGLGDFWSGAFRFMPFPERCKGAMKITLTHDPAAFFAEGLEGLVLSGHTHCGQIALPFYGPVYAPTRAPKAAWCGLYQEEGPDPTRRLFVSSGLGVSVIPFRFLTRAEWDLITLRALP